MQDMKSILSCNQNSKVTCFKIGRLQVPYKPCYRQEQYYYYGFILYMKHYYVLGVVSLSQNWQFVSEKVFCYQ